MNERSNLHDEHDVVLSFDNYRKWKKRQEQELAHQDYYKYPGCRECVNMVQMDMTGYICGALEDANTGESFYVLKDGAETVDYWNCDGESFIPKPRRIKPILRRK